MNSDKLNAIGIILLSIAVALLVVFVMLEKNQCEERYNDLEKKIQAWK